RIYNAQIAQLLTEERVYVYLPSTQISKKEILNQLVAPHASKTTLDHGELLDLIWEQERHQSVSLRKGLAVTHAYHKYGPRISMTMAVVPKGVVWDEHGTIIHVVVLFVSAVDTNLTYLEHLGKLA